MPRLKRFASTEIAMFFADHPPLHFHVLGRDSAALIALGTWEVIGLRGRVDIREALAWAQANDGLLWSTWNQLSGAPRSEN